MDRETGRLMEGQTERNTDHRVDSQAGTYRDSHTADRKIER
jgi:hypothetical protein